jgi:hypothetical protein
VKEGPYRTEKSIKSKNRMIHHIHLLNERTIEMWCPPVIKGVITVFVFRVLAPWWQSGLAPWWQSGESDLADSLARQTFAPSYITPPNMNPKSSVIQKLQSGRELNHSFCVFMQRPL